MIRKRTWSIMLAASLALGASLAAAGAARAETPQSALIKQRGACKTGFVPRLASARDGVCVTPAERAETRMQNANAKNNIQPGGGPYGPNTCRTGYVWREAFKGDLVCVTPHERQAARKQNELAASRKASPDSASTGTTPHPATCKSGFVWRAARPSDLVCVTPESRTRIAHENATAASRIQPGGGAYGPNTCRSGFVWREAFNGDLICVTPEVRTLVREENRVAASRRVGG